MKGSENGRRGFHLVDAFEGPKPRQGLFGKAISLGLKQSVENKLTRRTAPREVQQDILELMFNLDASEEQLNFETVFGSSKHGWLAALTNPLPILNSFLTP